MKFDFSNRWVQILVSIAGFAVGYYLMTAFETLFQ